MFSTCNLELVAFLNNKIFLGVPLLVWVAQEFASLLEYLHFLEEVDELQILKIISISKL